MIFTPEKYSESSVLSREVGDEMMTRLEWMTLKPRVIVDLGAGPGEMSARLQDRYQDAHVIAIDISDAMINHAKQNNTQLSCVCASACSLPFANNSVDFIFANFLFSWVDDMESLLRECNRVLQKDGLLMFTALGLDTEYCNMPLLVDMHDTGDLLLKNHFADPVLDVNYYTLTYGTQSQMLQELMITGMLTNPPDQEKNILPSSDGRFEVKYEVIFAHAFVQEENQKLEDGIVRIPLSHLRRQLRS